MRTVTEYLFPIFIMLGLIYIAGCMVEATFNLANMSVEIRQIMAVTWLIISVIFATSKALASYKPNN